MTLILAILLFIAGAAQTWFDWQNTIAQADRFQFADIGNVWAGIHFGSLQVLQPAVERYIGPWLWEQVIFRILLLPAAPTLFVLSALFLLLYRSKRNKR